MGILVVCLLYFSLRQVHFSRIWEQLRNLRPWQILAVLALDLLIYALIGARWWLLVRVENPAARLIEAIAVRLSVFGASYFTFGPQVGGEPIQILYLRRRHGSTLARATATVALDKLLELLANFLFLLLGIGALTSNRNPSGCRWFGDGRLGRVGGGGELACAAHHASSPRSLSAVHRTQDGSVP